MTLYGGRLEGEEITIHRKKSIDAASGFREKYFDWIYIDTDDSYNATWNELLSYKNKIKPGSFILGYDYTMGNWTHRYKYGVIEAVHRFCVEFNYELVYLTMDISEGQSFAIREII